MTNESFKGQNTSAEETLRQRSFIELAQALFFNIQEFFVQRKRYNAVRDTFLKNQSEKRYSSGNVCISSYSAGSGTISFPLLLRGISILNAGCLHISA